MEDKTRERAKKRYLAKRKRKQRIKRTFAFFVIIILVLAICVGLSLTVFFSIDNVKITTNTGHSNSEILDIAGVEMGDNLIALSAKKVELSLLNELFTCDSVTVTKQLPNTLGIEVNTAVPAFATMVSGRFIIISSGFRVIDIKSITKMPIVTGIEIDKVPEVGEYIEMDELLGSIISEIVGFDMTYITHIDISDPRDVTMRLGDKLEIQLKSCSDIPYQMEFTRYFVDNEMLPNDVGILDVSTPGTIRFLPSK